MMGGVYGRDWLEQNVTREEVTTERFTMRVRQTLDLRGLNQAAVRIALDRVAGDMTATLTAYLQSNKIHREVVRTERVPETWVDGVKLTLFPKWALKRWPAKSRAIECEVQFIHVCPHLPDDGSGRDMTHAHLAFVRKPGGR